MNLGLKKNLLFAAYLLFNVLLTLLLLGFDYGYIFVAIFVAGGHLRDLINVMYQLLKMKQILRRCPDVPEEDSNTICCLVPVHNEEPLMLKRNLDALTTQKLSENTKLVVMLLFDGLGDHNEDLFDSIVNAIGLDTGCGEEQWFPNWKNKLLTKLVYKIGTYNATPVILSYKEDNLGKKDSLIVGEKFIVLGIPRIESPAVPRKVDFIYHTDGDTISNENCLNEMLKSLVDDPDLDGVSGLLRTYLKDDASCTESAFAMMQDFQYFFSIIVRRMTESIMDSTTCLPGCSNMIRIGERTRVAIEKYGNLPAQKRCLVQTVTRMQGTDRRYTTLLLRQGSKLQMNWRAVVHTEPPLNATEFVNQRRRWSSNSFFNSMVVLYSNNIPMYIKLSTLIDISRVFTTIFRVISYLFFWVYAKHFSLINIVFFSIFIALPYLYAFAWIFCIVSEWNQMIAGFILNKILMPFLSVIAVTKMFFTSTNFAWGNRRVTPSPDCTKVDF